jgi:hypothetical protein
MHTKKCLAAAIISAVENARDDEGRDSHEFRVMMQNGIALQWADEYLSEGLQTCTCGWAKVEELYAVYQRDPDEAQEQANVALLDGSLHPEDYFRLARMCHGFVSVTESGG